MGIILCHKCAGWLVANGHDVSGLDRCACISGWVRGFERPVSRQEAIRAQIKRCNERAAPFAGQGRPGYMAQKEGAQELEGLLAK